MKKVVEYNPSPVRRFIQQRYWQRESTEILKALWMFYSFKPYQEGEKNWEEIDDRISFMDFLDQRGHDASAIWLLKEGLFSIRRNRVVYNEIQR